MEVEKGSRCAMCGTGGICAVWAEVEVEGNYGHTLVVVAVLLNDTIPGILTVSPSFSPVLVLSVSSFFPSFLSPPSCIVYRVSCVSVEDSSYQCRR